MTSIESPVSFKYRRSCNKEDDSVEMWCEGVVVCLRSGNQHQFGDLPYHRKCCFVHHAVSLKGQGIPFPGATTQPRPHVWAVSVIVALFMRCVVSLASWFICLASLLFLPVSPTSPRLKTDPTVCYRRPLFICFPRHLSLDRVQNRKFFQLKNFFFVCVLYQKERTVYKSNKECRTVRPSLM